MIESSIRLRNSGRKCPRNACVRAKQKSWLLPFRSLGLGIVSVLLTALPGKAAERIYFNYGALGFSVSVAALETYAAEGKVEKELAFYLNRLSSENQAKFRQLLQLRLGVNSVSLYRFLHSPMGKSLLNYGGEMIQIKGGRNGFYGIRGALVQAAADPEGLSLIKFMGKFPTDIQLNTERIMEVLGQISTVIRDTKRLVTALEQMTSIAADSEPPVDFSVLSDLRKPGKVSFSRTIINLRDQTREREFIAELYLPSPLLAGEGEIPVAIVSHGLGSNRTQWKYFIEHLASHGFAVALPQHRGSDFGQLEALFQGLEKETFKVREFIDRPLDITYLLDELDRLNQSQFQGKLNLKRVGIVGQSFGSYTALALAGAQINFEQLKQDCLPRMELVNLSLLLQCRALELPQKNYNLQDDRIVAAFITDPVSRSLFGEQGLSRVQIPIFWGAGDRDLLTPVVLEQVDPFIWLSASDKYLVLAKGAQHIDFDLSVLGGDRSINNQALNKLADGDPPTVEAAMNALSLAFFQVYLAKKENYHLYLGASYAQAISEEPYTFSLVSSLTAQQLIQTLRESYLGLTSRLLPLNESMTSRNISPL